MMVRCSAVLMCLLNGLILIVQSLILIVTLQCDVLVRLLLFIYAVEARGRTRRGEIWFGWWRRQDQRKMHAVIDMCPAALCTPAPPRVARFSARGS